jgi:hypothetical protein
VGVAEIEGRTFPVERRYLSDAVECCGYECRPGGGSRYSRPEVRRATSCLQHCGGGGGASGGGVLLSPAMDVWFARCGRSVGDRRNAGQGLRERRRRCTSTTSAS